MTDRNLLLGVLAHRMEFITSAALLAAMDAICARAMARKPADRYPTVRELAGDVERWHMGQGIPVFPIG